jgi:hypothetical protein
MDMVCLGGPLKKNALLIAVMDSLEFKNNVMIIT